MGGRGVAAFGRDVEGEERGAGVQVLPREAVLGAFVEPEEEELGRGLRGVVGGDDVGFGFGVGVGADERLDVGVRDGGEFGGVFH